MFGQEPRLPVDFLLGRVQETVLGNTHEWVLEHQRRLHVAFEGARERLKTAAERPKLHHDQYVRSIPLEEGQLVYLRELGTGGRHKIQNLNPAGRLFQTSWRTNHRSSVDVGFLTSFFMHPPAHAQTTPLTPESLEKIVEGIMERQQQQQQQQQQQKQQPEQRKRTKTCLACGQPKSRYENDGSFVHFFLINKALSDISTALQRSLKLTVVKD
ncbi:hypothetical protein Q7C36_019085 [Tachysurus vachellii]|uniref:Uncharacterized protein n=1 Tax=Tachysurus vachellii TaxID=175792 RepID=A0AA88LVP8_TACVA|nr:hypothetical protein Q7C36_019085 [Tachysurus vachellii]